MIDSKPAALSVGARRYAMVILAIVYMFNFVDRQILAILLPAIKEEFGVGDAYLGFLTGTAFALFYVILGIPIAQYADRCNRRNLIAVAIVLWSAMTVLSGFVVNMTWLILARIGVGVGEAGCSPPAHSLISDYFPPDKRSTAMGFYTTGISAGIMLAYLAGGWVVENIGWREAFIAVGAPGIALALLVRFTLIEPKRGSSENLADSGSQHDLREVWKFLRTRPSFIHMAVAAGLSSFVGYSVISFLPSFMDRSFDVGMLQVGRWIGLILGVAGGFGFFFGGYISDRMSHSGRKKSLKFISVTVLVSGVLLMSMFLADSWQNSLLFFVVPSATMNVYLAPVLAQTQSLVLPRMRATAAALLLLIINLIGMAFGPWITGTVSDILFPHFANESIRYALMAVIAVILPWASWHYYCASRWIDADLARAAEND